VTYLCLLATALAAQTSATASPLTIETLLDIKHPSQAVWSPDGRTIAFVWDRSGVQDVYVAGGGGGEPRPLTCHDNGLVDGLFWSRDGGTLFFERKGDLWRVPASGESPQPVWTTPDAETGVALSHDGTRVAFSRGGDLWVRSLADGRETRLTESPGSEGAPVWAPDDRRIACTVATSTPAEDTPDYSGSKIAFAGSQASRCT
jgi:Tol biopolymer transport system component